MIKIIYRRDGLITIELENGDKFEECVKHHKKWAEGAMFGEDMDDACLECCIPF